MTNKKYSNHYRGTVGLLLVPDNDLSEADGNLKHIEWDLYFLVTINNKKKVKNRFII